jgi:hypothetical protein
MVSGGYRPGAPQNDPSNISATGGDGQSGRNTQPARYISGLPYGQGQETMQQQTSAPMAAEPAMPVMPPITPLNAPTQRPNEPGTTGIDIGEGAGSEVMMDRQPQVTTLADTMRNLIRFDPSGDAELIYRALRDQGY